jgi:hypothetical protein
LSSRQYSSYFQYRKNQSLFERTGLLLRHFCFICIIKHLIVNHLIRTWNFKGPTLNIFLNIATFPKGCSYSTTCTLLKSKRNWFPSIVSNAVIASLKDFERISLLDSFLFFSFYCPTTVIFHLWFVWQLAASWYA